MLLPKCHSLQFQACCNIVGAVMLFGETTVLLPSFLVCALMGACTIM